ncbi:hypothetical protein HYFRA_00002665 [Hymenoscyphus fraxineus]|uniref:DUF2415 domain-containing protein n=1 Tax=Hymenoscyphus fraxineus TaxID=746836 RepID=A0A9N9LCT8_9HELO|nr:hypothetical protein HYFRA_00002665 [Hymenoscyphus fraxineus]
MAVMNESLHHATEDLILAKSRKFYRASIHTAHWQLRSLIGTSQRGVIYYPSGHEIIRLDTKSRQREVVTTVSFPPRCLTASKDWLCCGGEKGTYVAICLDERRRRTPGTDADMDPDERLPLDLDPASRSILREALSNSDILPASSRRSRGRLSAKTARIGQELVNCIELWSPSPSSSKKAYKIPVAVVSNNDHNVFIVDVAESEVLEEVNFPDCANRSIMSPDGELLVTICDDPFLYVHERRQQVASPDDEPEKKLGYEWALRGRVQLTGQRQADRGEMRGSFASSFSASGKYLAVATQYGVISIFETATLAQEDESSLLAVFTTSRPGLEAMHGAVRAMLFSPGPVDLLAWTEATGRVGVADVRNLCRSQQLITLDSHSEGMERVIVSDRLGDSVIDPRLRHFRVEPASTASTTPDYLGSDMERRNPRHHLTREMLDRHQAPLTVDELEVLSAHRIARRIRDAANTGRETSADTSNLPRLGHWTDERLSSSTVAGRTRSVERRIANANLPPALREFINPERSTTSIRSFINDRNNDRERRVHLNFEFDTQRLSNLRLTAGESSSARDSSESSVIVGTDSTPSEQLSLIAQTLEATGVDSTSTAWPELEALYRTRLPLDPPLDRAARVRIEIEDDDRRDFAHRLRQPYRPFGELSLGIRDEGVSALRRSRAGAVETMGCRWSEDGRTLYVGAEDGIYEYRVNVAGRKIFPSLVLR